MASKVCSICKVTKSIEDYHKDSSRPDGRYPYCRPCRKTFCQRSYYDNPVRQRERAIKYNYNIDYTEFSKMAQKQNYQCKICEESFQQDFHNFKHRHIHVDHCHITNDVRGILCRSCNHLLGAAKDNIDILKSAIIYLADSKRRVAP